MKNKKPLVIVFIIILSALMFTGCASIQKALIGTPLEGLFGTAKPVLRVISAENLSTKEDILDKVKVEVTLGDKTSTLALKNSSITVAWPETLVVGDNIITVTYDGVSITATIVLVAMTFEMNYFAGSNGSIVGKNSQKVKLGESSEPITAVPDNGYIFTTWTDGVTEATRSDTARQLTTTANFIAKTYSITFLSDDGVVLAVKKIKHNTLIGVKDLPSLEYLPESKQSLGFFNEDGVQLSHTLPVQSDATYKLKVKSRSVELRYLQENGTVYGTVELPYGDALTHTITSPNKVGHTFDSWSIHQSNIPVKDIDETKVKAEWISFTPNFSIIKFDVMFKIDGGTDYVSPKNGEYNSSVTPPATDPKLTGFLFSGWKEGGATTIIDFTTFRLTKNVIFVPSWKANPAKKCELKLFNNITNITHTIIRDKGDTIGDLSSYIPAQPGKMVAGIIDQVTNEYVSSNTIVDGNMSLAVKYKDIEYVITFVTNIDGQNVASKIVIYGGYVTLPSYSYISGKDDILVPLSMQINGWKAGDSNEYFDDKATAIYSDLTLYADVSIRQYSFAIKSSYSGASILINGVKYYEGMLIDYGTNVFFEITLNDGTSFNSLPPSIKIGNVPKTLAKSQSGNTYSTTIYDVRKDIDVTFSIDTIKYDISYANADNLVGGRVELLSTQCIGIIDGSHILSEKKLKVAYDGKLVFRITPFDGYRTISAYFGKNQTPDTTLPVVNNVVTLNMIQKTGNLNVVFSKIEYTVDWSISIPPSSTVTKTPGLREKFVNGTYVPHAYNQGFTTDFNTEIHYTDDFSRLNFEILVNGRVVYSGINGMYYRHNIDGTKTSTTNSDRLICTIKENVVILFKILE